MNNSDRAFIQDLNNLVHKHPEIISSSNESEESFEEIYEDEFMDDEDILQMALEDAIRIGDVNEIAYIRQDIQRAKVKRRMKRELDKKNINIKDLLIAEN